MAHVIRCVPMDWEHPKDEDGDFIPLYGVGSMSREAIKKAVRETQRLTRYK